MKKHPLMIFLLIAFSLVASFLIGRAYPRNPVSEFENTKIESIVDQAGCEPKNISELPKERQGFIDLYMTLSEEKTETTVTINQITAEGITLKQIEIFRVRGEYDEYICLGLNKRALWMIAEADNGKAKIKKISDNIDIETLEPYEKKEIHVLVAGENATLAINEKYDFIGYYKFGKRLFTMKLPVGKDDLETSFIEHMMFTSKKNRNLYSIDIITTSGEDGSKTEMVASFLDEDVLIAGRLENGKIISYKSGGVLSTYRFNPMDGEYIVESYCGSAIEFTLNSKITSNGENNYSILEVVFENEDGTYENAEFMIPPSTTYIPYEYMK